MASGDTLCTFFPTDAELPAANYPQHNVRNIHPTLDYDAAAEETAYFTSVLPANYAGGGITVLIRWAAASATSGDCIWLTAIERILVGTLDIDADSFASANTVTTTANGTSGVTVESSIAHTSGAQMDSLAAGETFRLSVARNADDGSDTMTGDAQIVSVVVKET